MTTAATTCTTSSLLKKNLHGFKTAKNRQTNNNNIKRPRRFIITVRCNKITMPYFFNNILTCPSKRSIRNSFHRKEFRRKEQREFMATAAA